MTPITRANDAERALASEPRERSGAAEIVRTTRSRTHFFMNTFRQLGCIEYNGGLQINNALSSVVLRD